MKTLKFIPFLAVLTACPTPTEAVQVKDDEKAAQTAPEKPAEAKASEGTKADETSETGSEAPKGEARVIEVRVKTK